MNKQLDLLELIKLYLRRWWVLLIGVLIGGILFGTFTVFFITPIYVSAGSLYTENTDDVVAKDVTDVNLNTLMVRKELVQTYAEVLTSNVFLKKVAAESNLGYSHEDLLKMISMSSKNETEILVVSVQSPNPQHAYIIAQVIMNLADEQIGSVVEGGSVKILDEPEYPQTFSSPNLSLNVQIGMLAGLLVVMILLFIKEMLNNKVKNAEQITRLFDVPVLGEIPYLAHNKKQKKLQHKTV